MEVNSVGVLEKKVKDGTASHLLLCEILKLVEGGDHEGNGNGPRGEAFLNNIYGGETRANACL